MNVKSPSHLVKGDFTAMGILVLPVTMGLLDATGRGGALAGSLGGQLLARSLSSSGLTCSLLGTSHYDDVSPEGNIENLTAYFALFKPFLSGLKVL